MVEPVDFSLTVTLKKPGTTTIVGTVRATGTVTLPVTPTPAPVPSTVPLGGRVKFGAFVYDGLPGQGRGDPWDSAPHFELERRIGRRLDPVSVFLGWDTDFPGYQFAAYGTRDILISWHPDQASAAAILAGSFDAYLDRWGTAVQAYTGGTVHVRFAPEMNGEWSRWSPANPSGMGLTDPAHYVRVWRYVVDRVRAKTAKVKWVWCPNITDEPGRAGNRLEEFYPGNDYIDVLGFDGYNWGDSGGGNFRWTSFADLLGAPQGGATKSIYDRLTALHPTAPVWWCEFGCKEPAREDGKTEPSIVAAAVGLAPANPGRSKATWYADALALTGFPRLACIVGFDIAKERDWRLASSSDVIPVLTTKWTAGVRL